MTLDEMLALLPDNADGQISAADLRTVVTELYRVGSMQGQTFSYVWSTSGNPGAGKVGMDLPWQMTATKILLNETTDDGANLTFALVDSSPSVQIWLANVGNARLRANIVGPTVDKGAYREIPISVTQFSGTPPALNDKMSVTVMAVVG